jgi:hypothetical protein
MEGVSGQLNKQASEVCAQEEATALGDTAEGDAEMKESETKATQDAQADANIDGGEARGKEAAEESEDEEMCRYCFEGSEEGELISPCKCQGGQKWVHLSCLRRWQRMVLVSQVCAWHW